RSAPLALSLRRAALLHQASLLRGCRRLRRAAALRHRERAAHADGQALQRELAIDSLRARVLGDRRHARARACEQPLALRLRERARRLHVEARLDARRRHVRVLAARARRAARADHNLLQRDRELLADAKDALAWVLVC